MTPTKNDYLVKLMNLFNAVCPAYFGQIEINENVEPMIDANHPMIHIVQIIGEKRYNLYKSTNDNKVGAYIEGISYGLIVANQEIKRIAQG